VIRDVKDTLIASFDTVSINRNICQDSCILFTNTSIGTVDSIRWSTTPTGPFIAGPTRDTTTMCFLTPGTYIVSLDIYYRNKHSGISTTINVSATPSPVITQTGHILSVPTVYSVGQWSFGGVPIPGALGTPFTWYPIPGYGTYTVVVDSNGCQATATWTTITTGVTKVNSANDNKFWLSQQGTDNNTAVLYAAHPVDETITVTMTDATGREIMTDKWNKGSANMQVRAASLSPGLYLIKLSNTTTSEVLKWLKN
jgi:hypothetical protein